MKQVTITTDGSCLGNPGKGGWAALLRYGAVTKEFTGAEAHTTNNRMELTAALEGLRALKFPCNVTIVTDSEYVAKGFERLPGWAAKGFKKIKNPELWQELAQVAAQHHVRFEWVHGHNGHADNERADVLARQTAEQA